LDINVIQEAVMRSSLLLLLAIVGFALLATRLKAAEQALPPIVGVPNADRGKDLAERWCKSCHLVGPGQTEAPADMPPPFAALAKDFTAREAEYRGFLQVPHAPMTEITLSRANIEDIIAYLHSLAPAAAN
jgi:mono/diheme cytochrome c family protein